MVDDLSRRDADDMTTQPHRATFREAVQKEDPATWGAEPVTDSTLAERPATERYDRPVAPVVRETTRTAPARESTLETEPPVGRPRFSVGATFLGWACASFFALILIAGLGILVGGTVVDDGVSADATTVGIAGIAVTLVALFLAYLIGGYAAGRIALWHGAAHGMGTVAWAVLFGLVAFVAGATLGDDLATFMGFTFDLTDYTGEAILGVLLGILASILGGAVGGRLGERYHERFHGRAVARRRGALRGRPL